jgi:hypothetical protein
MRATVGTLVLPVHSDHLAPTNHTNLQDVRCGDGGSKSIDMIYLLTAIGLSPGGSSTVHIYTQTKHRTIQNKQYIEQYKNFGRV